MCGNKIIYIHICNYISSRNGHFDRLQEILGDLHPNMLGVWLMAVLLRQPLDYFFIAFQGVIYFIARV